MVRIMHGWNNLFQWLSEFHNFLCFSCIHSLYRPSSNIGQITLFCFPGYQHSEREDNTHSIIFLFIINLVKNYWRSEIDLGISKHSLFQSSLKTHATSKYLKRRCNSKCFSNVEVRSRNKSFSWIHLVAQSSKQWYKFWLFFFFYKKNWFNVYNEKYIFEFWLVKFMEFFCTYFLANNVFFFFFLKFVQSYLKHHNFSIEAWGFHQNDEKIVWLYSLNKWQYLSCPPNFWKHKLPKKTNIKF